MKHCQKNLSEVIFNTAKCEYNAALKKSEFKVNFKYTKDSQKPKNRTQNIWFNSPHDKKVFTNVAKIVL